jgi:beta-dihydromenaquinone-9 omega-hydroxylase
MTSVAAHPAATIARESVRGLVAAGRRRRRATGPLGASFDPFDRATIADPAAAYRRLHAHPGVHPAGPGSYALAGYDDVRTAARAHDVLVSGRGVTRFPASLPMLITLDRPRHGELRRVLAPHFTAKRSAAMEPGMRDLTDTAVDRMLAAGRADAVEELAVPLPVTVIARLLGVAETDLPRFHRWSNAIVDGFHAGSSLAATGRGTRSVTGALALHRYMTGVFARLRREPGDDVISALLASQDGGALGDAELFWLSLMLLVAGNETTTNLIGLVLLSLARDPDAYARLRAEPELIPSAVEEAVRWGSPIQGLYRTPTGDYLVGETTIPAGARVLLMFGAANRDPSVFTDPDRFVIDRAPNDHLGFGTGIHFCLGAHLARVETRIVLESFVQRVARLELAGRVAWGDNPTVHGPRHLPLRLEAA